MTLRTHLVLGRVSNLPTVWTNALAGVALSGAGWSETALPSAATGPSPATIGLLMLTLSLFYVGGMYLNDAFDAEVDAAEREARPIPSGRIGRGTVFALGGAFLVLGILIGFGLGIAAGLAGIALSAAVVLYDWLHKRTALAPLIMGACRALSYAMAGLAAGGLSAALLVGGAGLFAHVVGLTYAAKQEAYDRIGRAWPLAVLALPALVAAWLACRSGIGAEAWLLLILYIGWTLWSLRYLFRRRPGDVPRGVVGLIAGIALLDAAFVAATGANLLAVVAALGFLATLALQRVAPGT